MGHEISTLVFCRLRLRNDRSSSNLKFSYFCADKNFFGLENNLFLGLKNTFGGIIFFKENIYCIFRFFSFISKVEYDKNFFFYFFFHISKAPDLCCKHPSRKRALGFSYSPIHKYQCMSFF